MPKARERSESARGARTRDTSSGLPRPWGEFLGIALLAIGVLMAGGLCSYQFGTGYLMGPVGHLAASALYATLGMGAYLLVLGVLGLGVKALLGETMEVRAGEGLGFAGATIAGCVLLHVTFPEYRTHGLTAGGLTGEVLGEIGLVDLASTARRGGLSVLVLPRVTCPRSDCEVRGTQRTSADR